MSEDWEDHFYGTWLNDMASHYDQKLDSVHNNPKIQINLLFWLEAIVGTRPELVGKDYITSLRPKIKNSIL